MKTNTRIALKIIAFIIAAQSVASADYVTHDGKATRWGVDDWTYVHTPVWAELRYAGGMASELVVTNNDQKHAIYVSGVGTGTNQVDRGSGRTGQEIPPGKTVSIPLTIYQTKEKPVQKLAFTYQYWEDTPAISGTWRGTGTQNGGYEVLYTFSGDKTYSEKVKGKDGKVRTIPGTWRWYAGQLELKEENRIQRGQYMGGNTLNLQITEGQWYWSETLTKIQNQSE